MKNDDFEKTEQAGEDFSYENEETDSGVSDVEMADDVSMYYPDGDGEHMSDDDGSEDPFHKRTKKQKTLQSGTQNFRSQTEP